MDKYKAITNDLKYVASYTPTSPQVLDLEYFDCLIFVAQSVRIAVCANCFLCDVFPGDVMSFCLSCCKFMMS
jgi:hypothetical protein